MTDDAYHIKPHTLRNDEPIFDRDHPAAWNGNFSLLLVADTRIRGKTMHDICAYCTTTTIVYSLAYSMLLCNFLLRSRSSTAGTILSESEHAPMG